MAGDNDRKRNKSMFPQLERIVERMQKYCVNACCKYKILRDKSGGKNRRRRNYIEYNY